MQIVLYLRTTAAYFFTLTLSQRNSSLLTEHITLLRQAYKRAQVLHPFTTIAICVLPDHLHAVWKMPVDDGDYALRWRIIKSNFSRHLEEDSQRSNSKVKRREKGIWQRRYWEHQIRGDTDLQRHVDYIHYNPVKHGLVTQVKDWPYSTFHQFVKQGLVGSDWGGWDIDGRFGE